MIIVLTQHSQYAAPRISGFLSQISHLSPFLSHSESHSEFHLFLTSFSSDLVSQSDFKNFIFSVFSTIIDTCFQSMETAILPDITLRQIWFDDFSQSNLILDTRVIANINVTRVDIVVVVWLVYSPPQFSQQIYVIWKNDLSGLRKTGISSKKNGKLAPMSMSYKIGTKSQILEKDFVMF